MSKWRKRDACNSTEIVPISFCLATAVLLFSFGYVHVLLICGGEQYRQKSENGMRWNDF